MTRHSVNLVLAALFTFTVALGTSVHAGEPYLIKHKDKAMGKASPDKALVYILRPAGMGTAIKMWAFVDDRFMGVTKGKNYTYALAAPGERLFWAKAENVSALKLTVEAGKTYFLKQKVNMGGFKARVKLLVVDESETPQIFKKCKYYVTPTERANDKAKTYIEEFYELAQERAAK
jgi:hypothetical protein